MRLTHFDYTALVKDAYKKKRANNKLSTLLMQSTPGKIRRECVHVYKERYAKKDEPTLRAFFGPPANGQRFLVHLQEFDVNKFRPLDSYLKGIPKSLNDRDLELLAWLIDFEYRPYSFDNDIVLSREEAALLATPVDEQETKIVVTVDPVNHGEKEVTISEENLEEAMHGKEATETDEKFPDEGMPKIPSRKTAVRKSVAAFLMIILFMGIYRSWIKDNRRECMYWKVDHYEPVDCKEEKKGRTFLPLDESKLTFKKINQKDTITSWSIGKIYYIKNNNEIEYYTEGGHYPEDLNRDVRKLSKHIFDKDSVNRRKQQ